MAINCGIAGKLFNCRTGQHEHRVCEKVRVAGCDAFNPFIRANWRADADHALRAKHS
jgi:hypothetical protein